MLQLIQSPSPLLQRLIKEECNLSGANNTSASLSKDKALSRDADRRENSEGTVTGVNSTSEDDKDQGTGASESLEMDSDNGSYSSIALVRRPNVQTNRVDNGDGFLVASSSYSSIRDERRDDSLEKDNCDAINDDDDGHVK